MKKETLDKLIDRLDHMDSNSVQNFLLKLAEQKGFFQQVFEVLKEGIILLNGTGTLVFANKAAAGILGKEPKDIAPSDLSILLGKEYSWQQICNSRVAVSHDIEINYPEHRFLNIYVSPIGQELKTGHLILIRDETMNHAKTEEMMESEQLNSITLLAAGVAHEIGNPLNAISLHLQILTRKLDKLPRELREEFETLLKTATAETSRLDTILKQFLQAIRPGKPQRAMEDINALIREILAVLTPEIEARGIALNQDFAEKIPLLSLDSVQIKQVIYNLVKNAYQSIPNHHGGSILVKTSFNAYEVRVTVSDTGSGISPEVMGSIYEPFLTTKSTGSGLGLLIVRRIIKDHGATVTIASNPDQGTTITLFFPRLDRPVSLLP
ncbi:MAG: ATP-binding protein [Akkermansia sp.]